jgi:hypothetical protein
MSVKHQGTYDLIELPTPQTYTPGSGIVSTRRTRMLKATVPAFTAALASMGYGWEVTPDENTPFAVVTTIDAPELTTTWTLDGNDLEKSIWQLPKARAMFELIPDLKTRAKIRHDIEAFIRGEYTTSEAKTVASIKAEVTAAAIGNAQGPGIKAVLPDVKGQINDIVDGLIASLVNGVEAFPISTYVLRKTSIYPPNTNISPAFSKANELFSFTALVTEEPTIPLNLAGILTEIKGYWQKKTPQASQSTDGRWTYTGEYWWADDYDPFLYPVNE